MRKAVRVLVGTAWVALSCCPIAGADPMPDHYVNVRTPTPPMRCEVSSDGGDGEEPVVVCQTGGFPQAPMDPVPYPGWTGDPRVLHQDQAIIRASGRFDWRTANLGLAPPGQPDTTLVDGQTYDVQGWKIVAATDGTRFTNGVTGHGMFIGTDYSVTPF